VRDDESLLDDAPSRRDALKGLAGFGLGTLVAATFPAFSLGSPISANASDPTLAATSSETANIAQLVRAHGIAMHGEPVMATNAAPFPYANPAAAKGGRIILGLNGTFDSLNPYAVRGVAPDAGPKFVWQSMMIRSLDEPFSVYGLVAHSVDISADRTKIVFHLRPEARFSDAKPLTSTDVAFSFELLKAKGKPVFRSAYGRVERFETPDAHTVKIELKDASDRELPLLIALMPIFAKHATDPASFDGTTLSLPIGSGPYIMTDVKPGESVQLKRDPNFWGKNLPLLAGLYNADELRYDFFRDTNTMFEAFKAGLYDVRLENDPGRWTSGYNVPAVRDGRIVVETIPNGNAKGMNAFVFNSRNPLFADIRVREALSLVFDFEWVNRNLYSGAYRRTTSFFEGSDLASTGRPASAAEQALLAAYSSAVRADILDGKWAPETPDGSGRDRESARKALDLLSSAGWKLTNGTLARDGSDAPFAFEIMTSSRAQERLALNYARSLLPLGIQAKVRLVDDVQYWRRLSRFEFDMIQNTWTGTLSPGGEQQNRWGSASADRQSSLNYAGVRSPAADAAIAAMLAAREKAEFVDAVRALDRILLSGFYVVPLFNVPDQWLARAAGVKRPARTPLTGIAIETFWREPA
jgi:peptide/nickel transport system substrate-binding protein